MTKFISFFILILCPVLLAAAQHQNLQLHHSYNQQLTQVTLFTGRYAFAVEEESIEKMAGDDWFFFVQVDLQEESDWLTTTVEISIANISSQDSVKQKIYTASNGGLDVCYFTSKDFNYTTQEIHAKVKCQNNCKFTIFASVSQPHQLKLGESISMGLEQTAFSRIFVLDTTKQTNFDQLRITLKPKGSLQYPAPIGLFINNGTTLPSKQYHDLKSITLWDNGQGVFINTPKVKDIFTILVQGPKNLFVLSTQKIVYEDSVMITPAVPYFDYLGGQHFRYYKTKVDPQKGFNLKLATFSGSIRLQGFYDELKEAISDDFLGKLRSFSQVQYQIPAQYFKNNKNRYQISDYILFKVISNRQSTFLVQVYDIKDLSKEITHLEQETNKYVDLPAKSIHQYYIQVVQATVPEFKQAQIEILVRHQDKKTLKARFFRCLKENVKQCQISQSQLQLNTISNQSHTQVSATNYPQFKEPVTTYKFLLPSQLFKSLGNNSEIKTYTMTIVIQNEYNQTQQYSLKYTNNARNIYLKQKQYRKERIALNQVKHYVFTNRQSDVKEVKVYLTEISGRVHFEGFKEDPRLNLKAKPIIDQRNIVTFSNLKLNQSVFIRTWGRETAYYSLQLQLIKQSQKELNRSYKNQSLGFNQIILFQSIPYEFPLQPYQKVVYQVVTRDTNFSIILDALLTVEICFLQSVTKAPFAPNCDDRGKISKKESFFVILQKGNVMNIGITNNNPKVNKFSIKYETWTNRFSYDYESSYQKNQNYTDIQCSFGSFGRVNKLKLQKQTQICHSFTLFQFRGLEIAIDIENHQFDQVQIVAIFNQTKVVVNSSVHIFPKELVEKTCKKMPCWFRIVTSAMIKLQLRYSLQYIDFGVVSMLDGIATTYSGSHGRRYFMYEMYNKVSTTIMLQNNNTLYRFYGNLVQASTYWKDWKNQIDYYPNSSKYHIKSNNPFYYYHQIAILTQKQIEEANCQECLLLFSLQQETNSTENGTFTFECSQEDRFLKENTPISTYSAKDSFAFYQLKNKKSGSLLVSINSQNQQCTRLYIKKGETRATEEQHDDKTQSNTLLIEKAEETNYAITVETTQDCFYSIEYSVSQSKIYSTIQAGFLADVRLQKSQSKSLLYRHKKNESFRILTLHQAGEVFVNVKTFKDVASFVNEDSKKVKFSWTGKDFLRIQKESASFCFDCYYLIYLTAQRQTKTSVIIPVEGHQFPIVMDSIIKDELKKGQYETLRIFTDKLVQFQINVQYGVVNVSLLQKDKDNQFIFTKVYKADQSSQYERINGTKKSSSESENYFGQFTKIVIRAEENSGFSFGLISDRDASKRGNRVKYGLPQYLSIDQDESKCLFGRLDSAQEQFLISITGDQSQQLLYNLQLTCQTKDKQDLKLIKDVAKNQMIVKIKNAPKKLPSQYEFCIKSQEDVFLTFIQSASLLYLPQNTPMVVQKLTNFSFYSQGRSILEVNQCKSRAITTILNSFSTTQKSYSEVKQTRKSNNIIEFLYSGPVYIQVSTQSGTISWRRKDQAKKIGFGYDEYSASKIKYSIEGNKLKVVISGVKRNGNIGKPLVELGQSNFTAFLAQEQMDLYDAINCANGNYLSQSARSNNPLNQVTVEFQVSKIIHKLNNSTSILVGALVVANSLTEGDGKYRFLYSYQRIPISAIIEKTQEQKPDENKDMPISDPEPEPESNTSWATIFLVVMAVLLVGAMLLIYHRLTRRCYRVPRSYNTAWHERKQFQFQEFGSQSER